MIVVDVNPDEAGIFDIVCAHAHDRADTPDGMPFSEWIGLAKEAQLLVPVNEECEPGYKYKYRMVDGRRIIAVFGHRVNPPHDSVEWNVYLNVKE